MRSKVQRASIVITAIGLALTGAVASTRVGYQPPQCRTSHYNDKSRKFEVVSAWHLCSADEILAADFPDSGENLVSGNMTDKQDKIRDYSRVEQAAWLGLLLTGIANALLWGIVWVRKGT